MQISIYPRHLDYLPSKKLDTDAGYDLKAAIDVEVQSQQITKLARLNRPSTILINGQRIKLPNVKISAEEMYARLKTEYFPEECAVIILPGGTEVVSAGFKVALPQAVAGFNSVMQIYPRSGLGIKSNLILANSVGVIDCNYVRDEVCIGLYNSSDYAHIILDRARVAQALFTTVADCQFTVEKIWDVSNDRGGGLGSTGV